MNDYRYWGFISYSQRDARWGKWLHRRLEAYRLPRRLVGRETPYGRVPKRAVPIFLDREELRGSADLGGQIREALRLSRYLLVVCSPSSASSQWVNEEVRAFKALGREDRVLCVIVAGEPYASDRSESAQQECLPEAVRFRVGPDGQLSDTRVEPLAADVRKHADGKRNALLKLLAGILGIDYDALKQRDKRRRLRRRIQVSMTLFVALSAVGAVWYRSQREADRRRNLSIAQSLATEAIRQSDQHAESERAALLAVQAYRLHLQNRGTSLAEIDQALRRALGRPFFNVRLHVAGVNLTSVAFNPDGRLVAAGGDDSRVRIWDLERRGSLPRVLEGRSGAIWSVAFAPSGRLLAEGTEEGRVLIWNLDDTGGAEKPQILDGHEGHRVTAVAFHPTSELLASGGTDGAVRLWDLRDPSREPARLCCHAAGVWALGFHPANGYVLATGGADRSVRIWDLRRPDQPLRVLERHDNAVRTLAFHPGGVLLASGTDHSLIMPSFAEMLARGEDPGTVEPSGGTIWLWDLRTPVGRPRVLQGHRGAVFSLAFHGGGQHLFSGSADGEIRLWDLQQPDGAPIALRGHELEVLAIAIDPRGRTLASVGGRDGSLRLWDLVRTASTQRLRGHPGSSVRSLAFSPTGNTLASAGEDGAVRVWSLSDTGSAEQTLDHGTARVVALAYGRKGGVLASGSASGGLDPDNMVRVWHLSEPDTPRSVLPHKSGVQSLAFSDDGQRLVSAGRLDGEIRFWKVSGTVQADTVLPVPSQDVLSLAAHERGTRVVWGSSDGAVWLWDRARPAEHPKRLPAHRGPVHYVALSADGDWLASGGQDSTVVVWDLRRLDEPRTRLVGHQGPVYAVAIDPSGATIASGAADGTIRLWNLREPESDGRILRDESVGWTTVNAVAFSPDGERVAAGGNDGSILIWPVTEWLVEAGCRKVWRNLTPDEWHQFLGSELPYQRTCDALPVGTAVATDG